MQQAALGIILDNHSVLLVKRRDVPLWVLPGGGIEPQESPEEAACREVLEETGLDVQIKRKISEYSPVNQLASFAHLFECQAMSGEPKISDETVDIRYFPLDDLPKDFFMVHRIWLAEALNNPSGLIRRPLKETSYPRACLYALGHPIISLKYLCARAIKRT